MKEIMLQATAEIVFLSKDGKGMDIPEGWEMEQTEEGINYLIRKVKDVQKNL